MMEFFAAAAQEQTAHGIFVGHEGIEQIVAQSLHWPEAKRIRIYFGNWQRDFSQFNDPKIYEAFRSVSNAVREFESIYLGVRSPLPASQVAFIQTLASVVVEYAGSEVHYRELLDYIIDLLAEDKFGPGFDVIPQTGSNPAYRLGVYRSREHVDNPITNDTDYGHLHPDFADSHNLASQGSVVTDQSSNRFGQLQYINASLDYIKQQFDLAATNQSSQVGRSGLTTSALDLRFQFFGNGLHTLEDFFAHSNISELLLARHLQATGNAGEIDLFAPAVPGTGQPPLVPLVTGCFGGLDTAMSIVGVLAHHLEQEEDTPIAGPTRVNRIVSLLLQRHSPALARLYAIWVHVSIFAQLPIELQRWLREVVKEAIAYLRKQIAWAVAEGVTRLIVAALLEKGIIPQNRRPQVDAALEFLDRHDLGHFIRSLGQLLGLPPEVTEVAAGASTFMDMNYQGDVVFSLHPSDPSELGHVLENLAGLYQKIKTEGTTAPTHTQLAKDHDTHPLHELAVKLATEAVRRVAQSMDRVWAGQAQVSDTKRIADEILRHPRKMPSGLLQQFDSIVAQWAQHHGATITTLQSMRQSNRVSLLTLDGRRRFLNNLNVVLRQVEQYAR
jgi:hypothetical protein